MISQKLTLTALGFFLVAFGSTVQAETIVTQRINSTNRILPLKKVTVGPDDQYASAADPGGQFLVFAHKADLVTNLVVQNLATGEINDLLPVTADSQEPVFSAKGRLAFTYFKFNARGDVCFLKNNIQNLKTLTESEITCAKRTQANDAAQRSNPFWQTETRIGYLERDLLSQTSRVVSEDLDGKNQQVLMTGRMWSPFMRSGGHLLAYNELIESQQGFLRRMVVKDLGSGRAYVVRLALPGLSGFPVISDDEKSLYFSHFMNDTNNDRAIDGGDNSVLFRLPMAQVISAQNGVELFPEQLTSGESSCSFPRQFQDSIYATCAFEGSLDIYRVPLTGIVPANWDAKLLQSAIQTSRSYPERVLLVNTVKFRSGTGAQGVDRELDERLFINHLQSDDSLAARFYLDRLAQDTTRSTSDKTFFVLTRLYLTGRGIKSEQPADDDVSGDLKRRILEVDASVAKVSGDDRFRATVRGLLHLFVNDLKGAESFNKQADFKKAARPLQRYLNFDLATGIYRRLLPGSLANLLDVHREMMKAPELDEQSHIFYAFNLVKQLRNAEPSHAKRIVTFENLRQGLPTQVATVLQCEAIALRLVDAKEEKDKAAQFLELDKIMTDARNDYFLRKALYVRAIQIFSEAAEFKYLGFVASNWLRYTGASDTEFIYAREVFNQSALDEAYPNLVKKNYEFAGNFFYQSLSLTDDLESHYGYVQAMNLKGQRKTINDRYTNLKNRKFIDDNMKFVDALLVLIDEAGKADADPKYVGHLDRAISLLEGMTQDRDTGMRFLLLGYCQLEKLLRLSEGVDFDPKLMAAAHRSLMLAYDLGRDNARIRISTLMDLGILHLKVRNFGLAVRFFDLREHLPFESDEERAQFSWLQIEALNHTYQLTQAAQKIEKLSPAAMSGSANLPLTERHAYALNFSQQFKAASPIYAKMLQAGQIQGDENLAKIQLAYGYALLKEGKNVEAARALKTSTEIASRLPNPKGNSSVQALSVRPLRLRILADGLLAQAVKGDNERIGALDERARLIKDNPTLVENQRPTRIQIHLQLAELRAKSDPRLAVPDLKSAIQLTEEHGDESQYLGLAVFRSVSNALAYGILHPELISQMDAPRIQKVLGKTLTTYDAQKVIEPLLDYQKLKLSILSWGFKKRAGEKVDNQELSSYLASTPAQRVKVALPTQWTELQQLSAAM